MTDERDESDGSRLYGEGSRALQDRFDTRRLADRIEDRLAHDRLSHEDRRFVESLDMLFLATVDRSGQPTCSYKGGDPGFVRVLDDSTLAFPSYDGNGMFLSLGNVADTAAVGLLFVDLTTGRRLRIHGLASIDDDETLRASWVGAQLVVRVAVTRVFPNCPRYVHLHERAERSPYVPAAGTEPPVPEWKKSAWACDVLPEGDPARRGR